MTGPGPDIRSALSAGDVFLCPSSQGLPAVEAVVGRVEPASVIGLTLPDEVIAHLQLVASSGEDRPEVSHGPFAANVLAACQKIRSGAAVKDSFEDGYTAWRTAVREENAGVFTIDPAQAYWMMLGILDQNGGLK